MMWETALALVDGGIELINTMSRAVREAELEHLEAECQERYLREQEMSCDSAVATGEILLKIKQRRGPRGWARAVRRMGMDPDSAGAKVTLFWFATKWPKVYQSLRFLGRARLCRVVREFDKVYEKLVEERPDGSLKARNLTQEELRERVDPVLRPKRASPYARAVRWADALEHGIQRLTRDHVPPDGVQTLNSRLAAASAHLAVLSTQ